MSRGDLGGRGSARGIAVLIGLALATLVAGCAIFGGGDEGPRIRTLSLAPRQAVSLGGGVKLGFRNVVNDSRCPPDVQCVWAGTATVRLWTLEDGRDTTFVDAVLTGGADRDDAEQHLPVEAAGQRITLLELTPRPRAGRATPASSYRALVRVERL